MSMRLGTNQFKHTWRPSTTQWIMSSRTVCAATQHKLLRKSYRNMKEPFVPTWPQSYPKTKHYAAMRGHAWKITIHGGPMVNQTWPPPVETDAHLLSGISVVSATRMSGGRLFRFCGFQGGSCCEMSIQIGLWEIWTPLSSVLLLISSLIMIKWECFILREHKYPGFVSRMFRIVRWSIWYFLMF